MEHLAKVQSNSETIKNHNIITANNRSDQEQLCDIKKAKMIDHTEHDDAECKSYVTSNWTGHIRLLFVAINAIFAYAIGLAVISCKSLATISFTSS